MISRRSRPNLFIAILVLALGACTTTPKYGVTETEFVAIEASVRSHITTLASEDFGGRRPGTKFETLTLDYIEGALSNAGYVSGTNDPGNFWRVPVPLISTKPVDARIELSIGRRIVSVSPASSGAYTSRKRGLIEAGSLIFVGKQAQSVPEDLVRGNVILMVSEPGKSPGRRETLFGKGAAAIITVVADQDSMDGVAQFYGSERISLAGEDKGRLVAFATDDAIGAALDNDKWGALKQVMDAGETNPIELEVTATIEANSLRRELRSHNIIGRLPGAKPGSGAILLLAHWDHFGECGEEGAVDRLCNGAIDNASGVAVMLELAKRLAHSGPHDRDIYVLGTTAEEWGLLGTKAFVENPPLPLGEIVAAFNFDTVALAPRGSPIGFVGEGKTPLDDVILATIARSNREVGDRELANQFINRQDGIVLLDEGVPTVVLANSLGDPKLVDAYISSKYHRPNDEADGIELGGAVDDLILHEELVRQLADTSRYP
jgi:hypothetical protein